MEAHEPTEAEVQEWLMCCPYPDPRPSTRARFQGVSDYGGTRAANTIAVRRDMIVRSCRIGREPWPKTGGSNT